MNLTDGNSDKVLIKDIMKVLNKYRVSIAVILLMTVAFSIQLTNLIDKKYNSSFEINVYSKYFRNPLISEIIPGVFNISEMRFTIDSMIKEAINDEYIDSVGNEFGIYSKDRSIKLEAKERQFLRDRFSYFSTGGQSYKVKFSYSDPVVAKAVVEKTLKVVKGYFINSRIATIQRVKRIMVRRLKSFNASQKMGTSNSEQVLAAKSFEVLNAELNQINNDIAALSKSFDRSHPKLVKLTVRKRTISRWLEEFDGTKSEFDGDLSMSTNKTISENLSTQFYTKYHDFNIALDIEKKSLASYIGILQYPQFPTEPIWPKKRLFASVGLILGFVFAFMYVFIKEITMPNRRETIKAEARKLNTVFLGTMPAFPNKTKASGEKVVKEYSKKIYINNTNDEVFVKD
jgi:capsular polysaccharide biosynthesis protein